MFYLPNNHIVAEVPPNGNVEPVDLPPAPTLLEHWRGETLGPIDESKRYRLTEAGTRALREAEAEYATGSNGAWRVA